MMNLDEIDQKIIKELEKDSRTPFLRIAKGLKVSEGTIRKRVAKLLENNVIRKFTLELSNHFTAIVGIETNPHIPTKNIVLGLKNLNSEKVFETAGRYDIICFLATKNLEQINDILEMIRQVEGVEHTETFTILKEN